MLQEFKDFINKGSFIDIAVGFVMGVAFSAVVGAFVDRIVNPLIGMIFSVDGLENWLTFAGGAGSVGAFIGAIINFVIIGFVIFMVVKAYNKMQPPEEAAPAEPSEDTVLLRQIRDSLAR